MWEYRHGTAEQFMPLLHATILLFRRGIWAGALVHAHWCCNANNNCNVARGSRTTATCDVTHTLFWPTPLHKHQQTSCTMNTGGSFPEVKKGGNMNITTYLNLRPRTSGVLLPCPLKPWCCDSTVMVLHGPLKLRTYTRTQTFPQL